MSAAELVDALWGLNVMRQCPSDSQLNLLVIVGTAQLGSLSRTSLVRALRVASSGTALNLKWWDSLQRTLLATLSSPSSMAGSSMAAMGQQQQQQQGGASVLSKFETLEVLAACESAERLAAPPGMKASPAAKASAKSTPAKAGGSARSGSGSGGGTTKGAMSGVVAQPLARVLLQSAHELVCAGELQQAEEVAKVVEGAASLEVVSSEGGLLSAQLLRQYEAATAVQPKVEGREKEQRLFNFFKEREGAGLARKESNWTSSSIAGNAIAAAERFSNVAWVMAQSGHMPLESWRSAFVATVTGVAPELMSIKGLLRALGAMHKLEACDAPVSPAWTSSAVACIASPQAVRAASPLELVRACLALQYLDERLEEQQQQQEEQRQQEQQQQGGQPQQGQQQQEQPQPYADGLWRGELRAGLLQEMVRKLQAGQAKTLAVGDVVDVLMVCAYNRVEVGKPLGMELMRVVSQHAETMPLVSLISAANAASVSQLQPPNPQQLENMLEAMTKRAHAVLTASEDRSHSQTDPSSSTAASPPPTSDGIELDSNAYSQTRNTQLGEDAHSQFRALLAIFATCKMYEFRPAPPHLAAFMARTEELLGSCQADIQELDSIVAALLTFRIQPSDVLLERLAASLRTAPSCPPQRDAEILSELIQLHLYGTPKSDSFMRVVGEGKQRLLQGLQEACTYRKSGKQQQQQQQQGDFVVPSETLLVVVPGLIKLDVRLGPLVELCLEELAENCRTAIALEPAVLKCRETMKLVEEWALLKLPLLSPSQMMELCFCFSYLGMAPSPELTQLMQPHIMDGLQNADTGKGELMDLRANSPSASAQIMPEMSVAHLILCLDYMKELGMGPFSSQWQDVLQKTVAAQALEQEMEPEIMNRLVCATMAIMPPGHTYSSWWSAIVHLACAQELVDKVPEEVESTIAPYITGATQEEQQQDNKAVQAEILEAEKFLHAREQQGGLSRKEQREVQEARAQISQAKQLHQQQEQQQQREDGTTYGIPAAPQADALLPPYSEAVRGLDDFLGPLTTPSPSTPPADDTIDMTPQGGDTTRSNDSFLPSADKPAAIANAVVGNAEGPVLRMSPSKAVALLSLCMALPHPPRHEWMHMLWTAVMPSVRTTAVAGGAAQEGSMAWFDAEEHWDLHALGMLGMLSMRAGFDPGRLALEMLVQAAAPQLLSSGVAPQTAIAILQVLTRFRYHPGDAWLRRFVASTQPVLHMLMPSPSGDEGPGSANNQASAALASALTCLADLNWPPPLDWLAIYYTILYKGGHVQRLSHGLLWSASASLAKVISLQAQQQQHSSTASEGQVPVPRQLVDLLAEEITARCTGDAPRRGAEQTSEIGPDDAERLSQAQHILSKF
ncbi:hypothetical protein DUNSADRAFT_13042 [Dunaliella salina]|uniref:Uncharacterized protein n=1 Tax=Dunaliella salina TaxID=3046 RepID=A0ABQ7GA56_DUNSA|nr:hypothetical protein DUNSADRAFT_13042 [Dunaliella salina]|eukprot:KAF5831484.1 hypothetical protein DUNSADRAFT_13042 [Dunaliella salina]